MDKRITNLIKFAEGYFNLAKGSIYIKRGESHVMNAKHLLWYIMHYDMGLSAKEIADEFCSTRRAVFLGIEKIRYGISKQKFYNELYNNFRKEYGGRNE